MTNKKNLVWFEEVDKHDVGLVGGKGANLGEMTNARLPVPYGFIVTSTAFFQFIKENSLEKSLKNILANINYNNEAELKHASLEIKKLILSSSLSKNLSREVVKYYENLRLKEKKYFGQSLSLLNHGLSSIKNLYQPCLVAVRSSATAEDLPTASFAGQQDTYLNVQGENHLLQKVKECYASLFTERAIYYRHENKFDHLKVGLAVVVQRMVESKKSGVAFSIDPVTNDKNKIVIEAILGLGEYIVQGKVTPDHYEIDKRSLVIIKKEIKTQKIKLMKVGLSDKQVKVGTIGKKQKLTDEEVIKIALTVKEIEKHYYFPQDIEWAIEKNRLYITQSRPITTIKNSPISNNQFPNKSPISNNQFPILIGSPASPGVGVGPVKHIFSPKEIDKIKPGDVMVAPQTNPDYVPAMKKAAAIVTEKGGRTSHAAIVSRELGIPAVVGADRATKILKQDMIVTVNGEAGEIYKGKVIVNKPAKLVNSLTSKQKKQLKTLTKIYVNLAQPEEATKVAKMNVDGVGLLRAEFIIADIGVHPKEFIKNKKESVFINRLERELLKFVGPFSPRPVVYRATDFKTNEYRSLKGGSYYEPKEENPMLGYRGCYRYLNDTPVFQMELEAIKKIWQKGYRNLHLMIPFVRLPWELMKIKTIIENSGLLSYPDFKLWMMVEVPSAALNLEEFLKIGVNGVSIGTNDLTMMILGVDRDSQEVASLYDERTPVVLTVLEYIVKICQKFGVTCSICGQAASDYPEVAERLVKAGITSLSVNPDAIDRTRGLVYHIEKNLNLKSKPKSTTL
ncbi:phosphoenolpyruvate synthase [Candidatus Roizmanbacteria bacterium CG23_combo_of_CG06-09_8_20_14_all_35_49]|uniref:Phosphoenolpyruvate synthase n=2 Tax=Candidatus Roizmaniibacteriota TaxID=1752723 RepID=A0A2M8F247_9BACT|nr:MAG: phosphoenolpyruvate synthase [Candidatus Roizmanbacteria bacterium CG23_combo_of_CG06-09_8_20_14_all_35_49]PJC33359.1 MAG: phosphoenolpyruvate synthase [Candidatus Roizmanbacteria bacterium CG_4_9_14_0_2_um_filter_35_15]